MYKVWYFENHDHPNDDPIRTCIVTANELKEMEESSAYEIVKSEEVTVAMRMVRKASTNEWVVKVYYNGKFNEEASYYTEDRDDAIATMDDMLKRLQ